MVCLSTQDPRGARRLTVSQHISCCSTTRANRRSCIFQDNMQQQSWCLCDGWEVILPQFQRQRHTGPTASLFFSPLSFCSCSFLILFKAQTQMVVCSFIFTLVLLYNLVVSAAAMQLRSYSHKILILPGWHKYKEITSASFHCKGPGESRQEL